MRHILLPLGVDSYGDPYLDDGYVHLHQVPEPHDHLDTPQAREAFKNALVILFGAHAAIDSGLPQAPRMTPDSCRLAALSIAYDNPQRAAFYACDTGVPNDAILQLYAEFFLKLPDLPEEVT